MNIDRGKSEFSPDERQDLAAQLREFKRVNGFSWPRVGQLTGMSPSTVSVICGENGDLSKYSHEQFGKLHRFFRSHEADKALDQEAAIVPTFQPTKTARRIHSIANWSRRGKISVIVGAPGVGKTGALKQYAASNPNIWMVTASPASASINAMLLSVLKASGANRVGGSRLQLTELVRDRVGGDRKGLIVLDEAQHYSDPALEELRAIHDDTGVGLLFSGNRDVLTRIEGASRAEAFAQFFRRVGMVHQINGPEPEDVALMLGAWNVEDARERAYLTKIAMRPGGGAIGQMSQVLELATILANSGHEDRVLEHIEDAARQLRAKAA
jgi:hypothetical protein